MRRFLPWFAFVAAFLAAPGGAAAASPTIRMAIVHVVQGCHSWGKTDSTPLTPQQVVVLGTGAKLSIRINCPMDFTFSELSGPALNLGDPLTHTGTVRTIVFPRKGVYRLQAVNVQSSAEQGLQTLGADNVLVLTVKVR